MSSLRQTFHSGSCSSNSCFKSQGGPYIRF